MLDFSLLNVGTEYLFPYLSETEISEELVLHFKGIDYIEYVIKERFKRDLLLKDLQNGAKQEITTVQTLITVKFKMKEDGTLLFVLGKGHIVLMVCKKYI